MLKITRVRRLSEAWRPHSELIKQWVANSRSEPKGLALARSYIYNLDFDTSLTDAEDGIELMQLLQKVNYPNKSVFSERLKDHFSATEGRMTSSMLLDICRGIGEDPTFINMFSTVILSQEWFQSSLADTLHSMQFVDVVECGCAIWKVDGKGSALMIQVELLQLTSMISRTLATKLESDLYATPLLLTIAEKDLPLWCSGIEQLARTVEYISETSLRIEEVKEILRVLASNFSERNSAWIASLQKRATQLLSDDSAKYSTSAVDIFCHLVHLKAQFHTDDVLLSVLATNVPELSDAQLLTVSLFTRTCERLHSEPGNLDPLQQLREAIRSRAISNLANTKKSLTIEDSLHRIHCLACVDKESAIEHFSEQLEAIDSSNLTAKAGVHLCGVMKQTGVYPRIFLQEYCSSNSALNLSQENCILLVSAMLEAGVPVEAEGELYVRALGRNTARAFVHRRSASGAARSPVSQEAAAALISCMTRLGTASCDEALVHHWFQVAKLGRDDIFTLLSITREPGVDGGLVEETLLKEAVKFIEHCSRDDLIVILKVLADTNRRDAFLFANILGRLHQIELNFESVRCAASVAHTLRLDSQFAASNLAVDCVSDLQNVSSHDLMVVLLCCSQPQRQFLLSLPGAAEAMYKFDVTTATPENIVLFLSSAEATDQQRTKALARLQKESPLKAEQLAPEDVVCLLERLTDGEPVEPIFRVAAATLHNVNESQLMRVFHRITGSSGCPNTVFRVVGKALLKSASSMSPEHALMWLTLYTEKKIRDDNVGKMLIRRASSRSGLPKAVEEQLNRAARFYGLPLPKRLSKSRSKKRSTPITGSYAHL